MERTHSHLPAVLVENSPPNMELNSRLPEPMASIPNSFPPRWQPGGAGPDTADQRVVVGRRRNGGGGCSRRMSVKWGARRPAKREGPTRRPRVQPLRVWGRRVCGQLGVGRGQEGMWGTDVSRERVRSGVLESWMHLHVRKMVWVSLINEFFFFFCLTQGCTTTNTISSKKLSHQQQHCHQNLPLESRNDHPYTTCSCSNLI